MGFINDAYHILPQAHVKHFDIYFECFQSIPIPFHLIHFTFQLNDLHFIAYFQFI